MGDAGVTFKLAVTGFQVLLQYFFQSYHISQSGFTWYYKDGYKSARHSKRAFPSENTNTGHIRYKLNITNLFCEVLLQTNDFFLHSFCQGLKMLHRTGFNLKENNHKITKLIYHSCCSFIVFQFKHFAT